MKIASLPATQQVQEFLITQGVLAALLIIAGKSELTLSDGDIGWL